MTYKIMFGALSVYAAVGKLSNRGTQMLKLEFHNPNGTAHPKISEFRSELREIINGLVAADGRVGLQEEQEAPPGAMGEPVTIAYILGILVEYQAQIKAVGTFLGAIKAARDLYVAFLSGRKKKQEREDRPDSLDLRAGDAVLSLPATDGEIERFLEENEGAIFSREGQES